MNSEKVIGWFKELIPYVLIIIAVLLIKQYLFTTVIVHGVSMEDNLHNRDIMVLNKIGVKIHGIKRFDIVVIDTPGEKIIKRVIALPGETISYQDNKLYINGKQVEDDYGHGRYTRNIDPVTLGEDEYYVLGDNRINSVDSRSIGPIKKSQILGHATFTIFPFTRIGFK